MILSISGFGKNFLCALLAAGTALNLHALTIKGTVKDSATQAPISGAMVGLLSDMSELTMTDASGAFTLEFPEVGIGNGIVSPEAIAFRGTDLAFSIGRSGAKVSVLLYDLRGNPIKTLASGAFAEGDYSLSAAPAGLPAGLYLVRARIGNQVRSFKMSTAGGAAGYRGLQARPARNAGLAKTAIGGVDWLVVSKTGYLKRTHEIMAYADAQAVAMIESKPATANLKIFSDSTAAEIDWANAAIYSWEQTATLLTDSSGAGFGGSVASMKVSTAEGMAWNGWAFHVAKMESNNTQPTADLSPYAEGSLHFAVKGNAASIGVMVSSPNQGPGTAPLINLADKGYLPDGEWHEIKIPVSEFNSAGTLKFDDVFVYCGFVSPAVQFGEFDATATYVIDEIYYSPTK